MIEPVADPSAPSETGGEGLSDPAADPRAARVAELAAAIALEPGQQIERVYAFEVLERRDVAFALALVTKRIAPGRLEMVAVGERVTSGRASGTEFVRRAAFPEELLPEILAEFIDRCGVEGAIYREVAVAGDDQADPIGALADLLAPANGPG